VSYAGIASEAVLFAYQNQIEIWAAEKYEAMLDQEPEDFSAIADQIFDATIKSDL
jgi:MraZ protein